MLIVFQLLFVLVAKVLFSSEDFMNRNIKEEKIEEPSFKKIDQPKKSIKKYDYGYRSTSSTYRSEFSGKAYYKMPIENSEAPDAFFTAGAKVKNSSMKLKELSHENETKAYANFGFHKEIQSETDNHKKIHLEFAQPVYDNKNEFKPSVELSYDIKF